MAGGCIAGLSFLGPILQDFINLRFVREANKIQQERADTAIERIGPSDQYQTRGFDDVYDPYSFESLNRSVQSIIDRGKTDASVLARNVGDYFNDPSVAAFKRKGLIDIGTASKARLGQAMESTGAQQLGMGRSLSEIGSLEDLMSMQEAEARSGQVAGVEAAAEDFTNRTNLARSSAMAQARLTGEGLENELTKLAVGARTNIGLSEADTDLRAALGASASDQANMDRILNAELSKAGIYTGVPYAMFQGSGWNQAAQNALQWNAINKPPKSSSGFSASFMDTGFGAQSGCIDGESMVFTPLGGKPLEMVSPEDKVLGADGNFHKVVAKDYGFVEDAERIPHVRIWAGRRQITLTEDHPIQGKAAKDWRVGDTISVDAQPVKVTMI